jgi:hypothetical protein
MTRAAPSTSLATTPAIHTRWRGSTPCQRGEPSPPLPEEIGPTVHGENADILPLLEDARRQHERPASSAGRNPSPPRRTPPRSVLTSQGETVRRRGLLAATAVVALNAVFILGLRWQAALPTEPLRERVRQAFASAALVQEDWLRWDSRRGYNQYNDCLILQMMINKDHLLQKAFGPVLYVKDDTWSDYCQTLFDLSENEAILTDYIRMRYTRYWHGYLPH